MKKITLCIILALLTAPLHAQTAAKKVLDFDDVMVNRLTPDGFRTVGLGHEKQPGGVFLCDNGSDTSVQRGVSHPVELNQTVPMPIIAEAWSRAEAVSGGADSDYSLYIDLQYTDGTPLWGQSAAFAAGTHDWQRRRVVIVPEKPVKSLIVYTLFRRHSGRAWFRNIKLSVMQLDAGAAVFDGIPVAVAENAKMPALQIRNVAANSDFMPLAATNFDVRATVAQSGEATTVTLVSDTPEDRCLTLVFSRQVTLRDPAFCEMRRNVPASGHRTREHTGMTARHENVAGGRMAKFPVAAVVGDGETGEAVGIDLAHPGFFRTGFNEATGELFVAVDFALTKESPRAVFRFLHFPFDARHGFRAAWAEYQKRFPDFFRCRTPEQGAWMAFQRISTVAGHEDFGFKFKEGMEETAWDDAHGILTFRYTEPMTWWMAIPDGVPPTYNAVLAHAKKLAEDGNEWAKALFTGGMKDADGRFAHLFRDTPWCNGVVWSFCDIPGIENGGRYIKWSDEIAERLYGEEAAKKAVLDGEYVDSSEGYVTAILNFDRDHFAAATTPLVFTGDDFQPAIFRGLVAYEYVRSMAEDVHGRGKLMMANATPHALCWLAPYLDVLGTETNWHHSGGWRPTDDAELMFRRAMCGPKPYCFLMNSDFTQWTHEMTEKFMRRALAYGMFPSFFSADASTAHYFAQPELYERDRELFKRYMPVCKEIAQAGWQPVTLASSSSEKVYVERFGDASGRVFLTVFNDSDTPQTVTIRLDASLPARWLARLADDMPVRAEAGVLTLQIGPEDVIVLAHESMH